MRTRLPETVLLILKSAVMVAVVVSIVSLLGLSR